MLRHAVRTMRRLPRHAPAPRSALPRPRRPLHPRSLASPMPFTASTSASAPPATSTSSTSSAPAPTPASASSIPAAAAPHPDDMARRPSLFTPRGQLRALDYLGTLTFASSGATAAATAGTDVFGAVVVGTLAAVGGGTIRDAVILKKRPSWTQETEYIWMCVAAASGTFFFWPRDEEGRAVVYKEMQWADALGVGGFCVLGVQKGIRAEMPVIVQFISGLSKATFGGVVRDLTIGKPVRILHSQADLYASTAAAGGIAYIASRAAGGSIGTRIWCGVGTAVMARWMSWTWDVRLPVWVTGGEVHEKEADSGASSMK